MNPQLAQLLRAQVYRFMGRCGSDPEVKYFESGAAVANVNLAVNQPGAKKDDGIPPDWIRLEVWGAENAQAFGDAIRKGSLVDVVGRVRSNTYTDRNGEEKHQWVMRVEEWRPLGGGTAPAAVKPAAQAPAKASAFDGGADSDDDVPF